MCKGHCVEFSPELAVLEVDCRNPTYYGVGVRYPDDLYEPNEAESRAVVVAAKRVYDSVLEHLKSAAEQS
jgi:hypothetical protein